ncbi:sugar phosphate isomerase/epimerase [Edaphobacter sp. 12200R-103]|uniref:sugar phosphate isomerase/epimerase family protein n=1 Tax=Edaphobacter sp. 12200R-103 TaxID=2703788 RepID=UPI00138D67F2|nr:sugar phosphate isomerase/epimerase family protein [Edaphobacter sp. 12200R-103]QHS52899.1 sugar phosphate isomerase/epimerase [Edaphobacter sp. 12200R-103]
MLPGVSTHVFLSQRLHPGLLDALERGGARTIELFAARHHFDYTDRAVIREFATWFNDTGVGATLHQPIFTREQSENWSRHVSPTLSLLDLEKGHRIEAMDEVKRALDVAELIPVSAVTLHLGLKDDPWDERAIENSLTAIEHIKAFAHPLGVKVLLENMQNDVTTPEHLLEILHVGHFDSVGITLDVGHAHLSQTGLEHAVELLRGRIHEIHVHDNQGMRDEHLWPGSGSIDWQLFQRLAGKLPAEVPGILEIAYDLEESTDAVITKTTQCFSNQARMEDKLQESGQERVED